MKPVEVFEENLTCPRGKDSLAVLSRSRIHEAIRAVRCALNQLFKVKEEEKRRRRDLIAPEPREYSKVSSSLAHKPAWIKAIRRFYNDSQKLFPKEVPIPKTPQESTLLLDKMCDFLIEKTRDLARSRTTNGHYPFIAEDVFVLLHMIFGFEKSGLNLLRHHESTITRLYLALKPIYDNPEREMKPSECEEFRDKATIPLRNVYCIAVER